MYHSTMLPCGMVRVRVVIPILIIFTSLVFIVYQWGELVSNPYKHILRLHDFLSGPIVNNGDTSTPPPSSPDPQAVGVQKYRELFSVSTSDKKYFLIDFLDRRAINPNIIPHPVAPSTWVLVAQRHDPDNSVLHPMIFEELTCNAVFISGVLQCLASPTWLPIQTPVGAGMCKDEFLILNLNKGPHDARVFYGPEGAYIVYGANSNFTCFGQHVQNFAPVVQWGYATFSEEGGFEDPTEMQRPGTYGSVEKNWFMFWDTEGKVYAHYDMSPRRSFVALLPDGSVGRDLADDAKGDEKCMERYMPSLGPDRESIHQATNSLAVTLCKRADPACVPDTNNTFIMSIFQHKRYRWFHSVYEPYAMLFKQEAPFEVYGISTKPYWIHGRWKPTEGPVKGMANGSLVQNENARPNWNQTEMFYITSMSWKSSQQKYHGYADDVLFLGFGIEDNMSAGIDVVVGDMLLDIGVC